MGPVKVVTRTRECSAWLRQTRSSRATFRSSRRSTPAKWRRMTRQLGSSSMNSSCSSFTSSTLRVKWSQSRNQVVSQENVNRTNYLSASLTPLMYIRIPVDTLRQTRSSISRLWCSSESRSTDSLLAINQFKTKIQINKTEKVSINYHKAIKFILTYLTYLNRLKLK